MAKQQPPKDTPPPGYGGYSPRYVVYPPEEPIDWGAYWKILVEQKKLIGAITGATTLVALLVAFLLTPIYRAEVLVAPVTEDKTEGLGALAGQFSIGTRKDKTAKLPYGLARP